MVVTLGRYASLVDPIGEKRYVYTFLFINNGMLTTTITLYSKHLHLLRFGIWIPPKDIQNIPAKNVRCNL